MSMIQSDLLLGQEGGAGYTISRSLRFNSSDSAFLSRTPASAGNRKTWTWAGWVKRCKTGQAFRLLGQDSYPNYTICGFTGSDKLYCITVTGDGSTVYMRQSIAVYRDTSAWYHVTIVHDTTDATTSNRYRLYVNGSLVATELGEGSYDYPPQNTNGYVNATLLHHINYFPVIGASSPGDSYLADVFFIDGQALDPSSFVVTSATTGQLIPKAYTGSFGTNGFWLKFSDNSAATATTLGKDYSGNSNNWTPNNLSVTAGAGNDSLVDTPTSGSQVDTGLGGQVTGNYCTLNPLVLGSTTTLLNGNLQANYSGWNSSLGTIAVSSGKWFYEVSVVSTESIIGFAKVDSLINNAVNTYFTAGSTSYGYYVGGSKHTGPGNSSTSYGASYTTGDVIGVALDLDAGTLTFYKNGSSQGVAFSSLSGLFIPVLGSTGQPTGEGLYPNFGQRPFAYTAPSGFKALVDTNLPAPVVAKSSDYFQTVLYTGNGSTQTISGLGFSPDLVWIKSRTNPASGFYHHLVDAVRGSNGGFLRTLYSNTTEAEDTYAGSIYGGITSLNSDGFSLANVGSSYFLNNNTTPYAAWCFDAGSNTVSNTQGSITSQVRANPSAGFSVVTYTGNGSSASVGHGLNAVPSLMIVKRRDSAVGWVVYHSTQGKDKYLLLNTTNAAGTEPSYWGGSGPSSTVINYGSGYGGVNTTSGLYVAYCFAPVAGYSAMGSYVGNGAQPEGPMITTMFKPRWVLIKSTSSADDWVIFDTARNAYNVTNTWLRPNDASAEITDTVGTVDVIDIVSNGFKVRGGDTRVNGSGYTYIYFAVAESPFAYSRAR